MVTGSVSTRKLSTGLILVISPWSKFLLHATFCFCCECCVSTCPKFRWRNLRLTSAMWQSFKGRTTVPPRWLKPYFQVLGEWIRLWHMLTYTTPIRSWRIKDLSLLQKVSEVQNIVFWTFKIPEERLAEEEKVIGACLRLHRFDQH